MNDPQSKSLASTAMPSLTFHDHWFHDAFHEMADRMPAHVCFRQGETTFTCEQMRDLIREGSPIAAEYFTLASGAALKLAEFMINDGDRALSMTERADAAQAKHLRDQVRALIRENAGLRADLADQRERLYPETSKNVADVLEYLQGVYQPAAEGELNALRREVDELKQQLNESETMLKEREIQFRKRMRLAIESVFDQEPSP